MRKLEIKQKEISKTGDNHNQNGSALVIAVFVLALISVFVALALSRTASEAAAVGNEATESRTFYAAQGSLEVMTRNFNKVFETKLNPSDADLNLVRNGVEPRLGRYTFFREVQQTSTSSAIVLSGGPFTGLYAVRDNWRLRTTATDLSGIQVELTRNILNNRIPIFQFGIFNDDDLELYRPPLFSFGGRVHTNKNFFISPGTEGVYFDSRVTAVGHIITQTWRNWNQSDINNNQTFIKNASRVDKQLLPTEGSVLNTAVGAADNVFASEPNMPPSKSNPDWETQSAIFDGNLKRGVDKLKLPIKVGDLEDNVDLVEMIKRGKKIADTNGGDLSKNNSQILAPVTTVEADSDILQAERFANKTGIRVSLADTQAKLPGCASGIGTAAVTGDCGIRLDGNIEGKVLPVIGSDPPTGNTTALNARGYQPRSIKTENAVSSFDYTPTRVNGERLYINQTFSDGQKRGVWIKVETVQTNSTTGAIETKDITQDFLSLGVTEQIPANLFSVSNYNTQPPNNDLNETSAQVVPSKGTDSRSIIKIQRFAIPGETIPGETFSGTPPLPATVVPTKWLYPYQDYNFVVRYFGPPGQVDAGCSNNSNCKTVNDDPNNGLEHLAHFKQVTDWNICNAGNNTSANCNAVIVPFPIKMFDTREGTFFDNGGLYDSAGKKVTNNGVMSMIDIDVANLRRFLRGDFNGLFPRTTPFAISKSGVGLMNTDIPQKEGWVLYISDRRGDRDFDGEYDMEDIYGYGFNSATNRFSGCDGVLQPGEDVNKNGLLDKDFGNEAANKYDDDIYADKAAATDHRFYRRGIRLINGTVLPGILDLTTPSNTRGFTVASENGVYVYGNYNTTGVASVPVTGNTPYEDYRPFNTATHIPASIIADSVTILSNSKYFASGSSLSNYIDGWNDAKSFAFPYDLTKRLATETHIRFAMISGDAIASKAEQPHQGGVSPRLNGGVHNFKRFLERWTDPAVGGTFKRRLNYSGSLINLFNSNNNNGSFKCCNTVYNPPIRNWVFDSTFLDPARLPPGTPFFQYVQVTGFQRSNE